MSGDTWLAEAVRNEHIRYVPWNSFGSIEPIAKGGYGVIRRAVWKTRKKEVALKSLNSLSFLDEDKKAEAYKELVNELKLLRNFADDDRIIRFYGLTRDPNQNYIVVMQYANGGTLRQYLAKTFANLSWHDKRRMAIEIASALDCLHSENIVHRDLHSKNILIHNNRALIADFGLSRRAEKECTASSKPVGMIAYIDPQRVCNPRLAREKLSDVYSFGVLLWELSSGRVPFNGRNDLPLFFEILGGVRETPVTGTPVEYEKLYTDCWDFNIDRRPQSTEALLQRLGRVSLETSRADLSERTAEIIVQKDDSPSTLGLSLPSNVAVSIENNAKLAPCDNQVRTSSLNLDLTHSHDGSNHGIPTFDTNPESADDLTDDTTRVVDDAISRLSWGTLAEVSDLLAQHLAASNKQGDDDAIRHIAETVIWRAFDLFPRNSRFNGNGNFHDLPHVRQQEMRSAFTSLNKDLHSAHKMSQEDEQNSVKCLELSNEQRNSCIGYHFKEQLVMCFIEAFRAKFPCSDPKILGSNAPLYREPLELKHNYKRLKPQRLRPRRTRKDHRDRSDGTRRGRLKTSLDDDPHDPGGTRRRFCERQPMHFSKFMTHQNWNDSAFSQNYDRCDDRSRKRKDGSGQYTMPSANFFQFCLIMIMLYPAIGDPKGILAGHSREIGRSFCMPAQKPLYEPFEFNGRIYGHDDGLLIPKFPAAYPVTGSGEPE